MTKKEKFIYENCIELLKENRINNMTIDEIANYLSISKVTIYKYFKSRDLLMEKVFLYFLQSIMTYSDEYLGIDKIKIMLELEIKKASIDINLMNNIISNSSDDFKEELVKLQQKSMNALQVAFEESKEQGYFKGFVFEDFIDVYSIYINGIIKNKDNTNYERSIQLFARLILNSR